MPASDSSRWTDEHTCHSECPCQTGGTPVPDFVGDPLGPSLDGAAGVTAKPSNYVELCHGECGRPIRPLGPPATAIEWFSNQRLYCLDCLKATCGRQEDPPNYERDAGSLPRPVQRLPGRP